MRKGNVLSWGWGSFERKEELFNQIKFEIEREKELFHKVKL